MNKVEIWVCDIAAETNTGIKFRPSRHFTSLSDLVQFMIRKDLQEATEERATQYDGCPVPIDHLKWSGGGRSKYLSAEIHRIWAYGETVKCLPLTLNDDDDE